MTNPSQAGIVLHDTHDHCYDHDHHYSCTSSVFIISTVKSYHKTIQHVTTTPSRNLLENKYSTMKTGQKLQVPIKFKISQQANYNVRYIDPRFAALPRGAQRHSIQVPQ